MEDRQGIPCTAAAELGREIIDLDPPDMVDISVRGSAVHVDFPDGEFTVAIDRPPGMTSQARLTLRAVMRATPPDLGTWWCEWERRCAPTRAADSAVEEMLALRARFRRLLEENSGRQDARIRHTGRAGA